VSNPAPNADRKLSTRFRIRHRGFTAIGRPIANDSYYGWKGRGARTVRFKIFTRPLASGLNAGTVGLQTLLPDSTHDQWLKQGRIYQTYEKCLAIHDTRRFT
jgi:hypothetical protein